MHPIYNMKSIQKIESTHVPATTFSDKLAFAHVKAIRFLVDLKTGFKVDAMNERNWINRAIWLETIGAVPAMVGGMSRHMKSIRTLKHDHGMIHHLLNEAENERTHLFIFLRLKQPGAVFKFFIGLQQALFFNWFFLCYMVSPTFCHRFVGYLEEEAVHNYTMLLEQIEKGRLPAWETPEAPKLARDYYELPDHALMKEVILAIRADESIHRDVNHRFADIIR